MISCQFVQNRIASFLDGELGGADTLRIRDHIARCAECAGEMASLKKVKQLVGSLPQNHPAPDMEDRLLRAIRSPEAQGADARGEGLLAGSLKWVAAFSLAAAAAVFVFQATRAPVAPGFVAQDATSPDNWVHYEDLDRASRPLSPNILPASLEQGYGGR